MSEDFFDVQNPAGDHDQNEENEDGSEDDDLYGDLETSIFQASKNSKTKEELQERIANLESTLNKAAEQVKDLSGKLRLLKKQNMALIKNSSALAETAKSEVNRKNFLLCQLQRKLEQISTKIKYQWNNETQVTKKDLDELLEKIRESNAETGKKSEILSADILQIMKNYKSQFEEGQRHKDETLRKKRRWNRKVKLDNVSIYLTSEQCNFKPLEQVEFPKSSKANISKK